MRLILLFLEVTLKNTPLNPYSDSFLAASIISRFESGLFGKTPLPTKIVTHFLITILLCLYIHKLECVFRQP